MIKTNKSVYLFLFCSLVGCGFSTDGGGFRTSDKQYTELLYAELNKNNVMYTIDQEGYIYYDEPAKKGFLKAQAHVERYLYDSVNHKVESTKHKEYFISLLEQNNQEYYVLTKDDGIWIKWFPESEEQEREYTLQVVNYIFDNR